MRKRLTQIGNSLGVVIDKPILELLDIDAETELELTTEGGSLVLTPLGRKQRRRPVVAPQLAAPTPRSPRYGFPKKQPW